MRRPIITLTTDFGPSSSYVAQMKGAVLQILDDVELVDVTHAIPPQQILAGAVTLADAYRYFPRGSIHVAVVDPGVGTARAIVLADIDGHYFVAPDNGLLSLVAQRTTPTRLVRLESDQYWRRPVSQTFHGRDVMAPVAAHLAAGVEFERFGVPLPSLQDLDIEPPAVTRDGAEGRVLLVDAFGNAITNLGPDSLPDDVAAFTVWIEDQTPCLVPRVATYAEQPSGTAVLLVGSNQRLELAVVDGNAAQRLAVVAGNRIRLQWSSEA